MGGLGMGLGFWGLALIVLFWGGLIALALWLVRGLFPTTNRPASPGDHGLSAREILDLRYARGEISREEYNLMRETISDGIA